MPIGNTNIAPASSTAVNINDPFAPKPEQNDYAEAMVNMLRFDPSFLNRTAHDIGTLVGLNADKYQMAGQDAFDLALAAMPLAKSGKRLADAVKAEEITLSHYSKKERGIISRKFQGTGYSSQELNAGMPKERFINVYDERKGLPEATVVKFAPVRHEIKGKFKILDLESPIGKRLLGIAKTKADAKVNGNRMDEFSRLLIKEGFDGMHNSEFMPQTVRIFKDLKPTKIIKPGK